MVAVYEPKLLVSPEPEVGPEFPKTARNHLHRGNDFLQAADLTKALAEYEVALKLIPDNPLILNNLGIALSYAGDYSEALAAFNRAIEQWNDFALLHHNRASVLGVLGRYEEALAASDRAIELQPDLAEAYDSRALALFCLKRYKEALAAFDRAIALGHDDKETRAFRSLVLKKLLRGLATGGWEAWLGYPPKGSNPPIRLKPGAPSLSDAIIEDRR